MTGASPRPAASPGHASNSDPAELPELVAGSLEERSRPERSSAYEAEYRAGLKLRTPGIALAGDVTGATTRCGGLPRMRRETQMGHTKRN